MTARISACGRYRYRLTRIFQPFGRTLVFICCNPSTADASEDDATIRRLRHFTLRGGFGRLIVGNVFAYRATNVRELSEVADPVGPDWQSTMVEILDDADLVVCGWGSLNKLKAPSLKLQVEIAKTYLRASNKPLRCFARNKDGTPKHPLYVHNEQGLIKWN